jgi:acyl-CoA reductase-like NAD-dependent aldehyde dehydrogenase
MESDASSLKPAAGLWIGGEWITPPQQVAVHNPATGEPVGLSAVGTWAHLDLAVAAAQRAFAVSRRVAPYERAELLLRIAEGVERRQAELSRLIVAESGKPVTLAEAEVKRAVNTFTVAAEEARRFAGEVLSMEAFGSGKGHQGWARRFPVGIVYGISPFNFPLNLVAHKLAPCLATGNSLILKPAPKTPLTAWLLAEILGAAGVPPGQVNIVTCSNEDAGHLVGDPRVAMTSFTGSPEVGWRIKERAGRQKVTLELGGNAAVVVHEDADLDFGIPAIASGAFANAGQSCISVQRILVHRPIYAQFRQRLLDHVARAVVVGDPQDRRTVVGPMIDIQAVTRTLELIRGAVEGGARVIAGGTAQGLFLKPTILEEVSDAMPICSQEAFAPVVNLQVYDRFEDALARVNDSRFGLQAGLFTRDLTRAFQAFETLEVGGVLINNVPTFRVENMPYGGIKASGFGREGVRYAMEEMTEIRSMIIRHS